MHNRVRRVWAAGKPAINIFVTVPSAFSAELLAQADWDSITVDMQHGLHDYQSMVAIFQGLQSYDVAPMVRVPSNEAGAIGKVLDAGAYGVICPLVNTAEEAEAFVSACRYPPAGHRSSGPMRAGLYGAKAGYHNSANDEILCLPMIETGEAFDNIDEILSVPGVDGIYIGPSDLAISIGLQPGQNRQEPELLKMFKELRARSKAKGVRACLHGATPEYALQGVAMGFDLVTATNDARLIQSSAKKVVDTFRAGLAATASVPGMASI